MSNEPPIPSLSGTWVGSRPGEGMVLSFSGCGACAETPAFNAIDVVMNVSDSNHALSGNATLTLQEAPPAGCAADPGCNQGPVGAVIPASVTGAVGGGGRVTMQWDATMGETPVVFELKGTVFANRMSGTVILSGGGVPGGSAIGIWSVVFSTQ